MKEKKLNIKTIISPTLREASGLAMSSRNMRLSEADKTNAAALYQSLLFIQTNIAESDFEKLKTEAKEILLKNGFEKIDYIEIADAATLLPVSNFTKEKKLIVLSAAIIGGVRLIDNVMIN